MVRLNKIYTRTGDKGKTHLSDGSRTQKTDQRVSAYGAVDELNSALGLAMVSIENEWLQAVVVQVQNELFDLGADLSHPGPDEAAKTPPLRIIAPQIDRLEAEIDQMNDELPPLRSFVLPGGTQSAARLYLARAVCRRAEREALILAQEQPVNELALCYLNRLSDHLFVCARWENRQQKTETLWVPGANRGDGDGSPG